MQVDRDGSNGSGDTDGALIVCPPLSKGGEGNPNFENFEKGGNLKINFGVGETKRGGGDFQNKAEFRDRKEHKWGLLRDKLA